MGLDLDPVYGQTPLDEEEKEGLLIPTISTRQELDEFEQRNIEDAVLWLTHRKLKPEVVLSEKFANSLHKRMFGSVWKWAGLWRRTDKNLGIDKRQIPTQMRQLMDDARYWLEHETYSPDEMAIRFKHRIVSIHCYANGNGRHSRLMADVIAEKIFKRSVFSWGMREPKRYADPRKAYLEALRVADKGNVRALLEFARG